MSSKLLGLLFSGESQLNRLIFFLPLVINICMFADNRVTLESPIIKIADGSVINADKVEFIRKYRNQLLKFILGELLPNNQRRGKYNLFGKWYSIEDLARIEREVSNSTAEKDIKIKLALEEILTLAKADFVVYSKEFIESGRGSKNIMTVLIQEDCQKRDRMNSHLLEWAKTKEGQGGILKRSERSY